MLDINNNNIITLTRGDTHKLQLYIFNRVIDGLLPVNYFPQRNDKIFFAIMEPNQRFEDAIVKKVYTVTGIEQKDKMFLTKDGALIVKLDSKDTEFLQEGDYYYTIKLLRKSAFLDSEGMSDREGSVTTIVEKTKLYII